MSRTICSNFGVSRSKLRCKSYICIARFYNYNWFCRNFLTSPYPIPTWAALVFGGVIVNVDFAASASVAVVIVVVVIVLRHNDRQKTLDIIMYSLTHTHIHWNSVSFNFTTGTHTDTPIFVYMYFDIYYSHTVHSMTTHSDLFDTTVLIHWKKLDIIKNNILALVSFPKKEVGSYSNPTQFGILNTF